MVEHQVVIGVFNDAAPAREAVEALRHAGFAGTQIGLVTGHGGAPAVTGLLEGLGVGAEDAGRYAGGVPPDGALVALRTDERADEARDVLQGGGAAAVETASGVGAVTDLA